MCCVLDGLYFVFLLPVITLAKGPTHLPPHYHHTTWKIMATSALRLGLTPGSVVRWSRSEEIKLIKRTDYINYITISVCYFVF
jgi:hypothetical protein